MGMYNMDLMAANCERSSDECMSTYITAAILVSLLFIESALCS